MRFSKRRYGSFNYRRSIDLVNAHARFFVDLYGMGVHSAVDTDLHTAVGLIAGGALIGADALFEAVKTASMV